MPGLTKALLYALNPSALGEAAQKLVARAAKYDVEQSQFAQRLRYPQGGDEWTGQASDALQQRAGSIGRTYGASWHALTTGADQSNQAQGFLTASVDHAKGKIAEFEGQEVSIASSDGRLWQCGQPFQVADEFTVQVKPGAVPAGAPSDIAQHLQTLAAEHTADVKDAVRQVEELSTDWAKKLQDALDVSHLALDSHGNPIAPYDPAKDPHSVAKGIWEGSIPLPQDPHVMHELWEQLNPGEKDKIFGQYPHVGDNDGIPAVDKDHYNRVTLDRETDEKRDALQRVQDEHKDWNLDHAPHNPGSNEGREWRAWKNRADAAQADLQKNLDLQNALKPPLDPSGKAIPGQERFLLQHDKDTTRSVVSAGNPDTAKNLKVA